MPSAVPARLVRPLVASALVLATAACWSSSDPTSPTYTGPSGGYMLTAIAQGDAEPCVVSASASCTLTGTGATTVVVKSGTFNLASNGTFTMTVKGTRNGAAADVGTAAGSYAETASGLSLSVTGVPAAVPATWGTERSQIFFALPGQTFGATGGTTLVVFTRVTN